jgi:hypothetical protein
VLSSHRFIHSSLPCVRIDRSPVLPARYQQAAENSFDAVNMVGGFQYGTEARITSGCSKRPFSKAAASEEARRTLRYVEPQREARTPLAVFFSILLV